MTTTSEKILLLLSSHRIHNRNSPLPLTTHQIFTLVKDSLSPRLNTEQVKQEVEETLIELESEGEVFAGAGNRYIVTPPMVLTAQGENIAGLRFRGDRSYLPFAHEVLETNTESNSIMLHPRVKKFYWAQERLHQVGIRLATVDENINTLPLPRLPLYSMLRSVWEEDPFTVRNWPDRKNIVYYQPSPRTLQQDRWRFPTRLCLKPQDILRLPTGNYLWFEKETFYELDPETALLALFYRDKEMGCPLKINWDSEIGQLNLQNIFLPGTYIRWLWNISQVIPEQYRVRYIAPINRPFVEAAFKKLGCELV